MTMLVASSSEAEADTLFNHPDGASDTEKLSDPVLEVADRFFAAGPVIQGRAWTAPSGASMIEFEGISIENIFTSPGALAAGAYCAVSYEAAKATYTSPSMSSRLFEETVGRLWGPALTPMDPPEHTKYREIMQRGFTPRMVKTYEDSIIRPVIARRFAAIRDRGRGDLVRELNCKYPFEVIAAIVGFEPDLAGFVGDCFYKIWQWNTDPAAAYQGSIALQGYARELIQARRHAPRDDLVSAMLACEVDGEPISDERMIGLVNHFLSAAIDTTFRQSGNIVHAFLSHPGTLERLREDRSLIPRAVEEAIRWEGIGNLDCRQAAEDTELCGVAIPAGAVVFVMAGVTSRDASRWLDPHRFDIDRPTVPHMHFASGPHTCIGQHIARFMLCRYVEQVLDDMPGLRWDPETIERPRITGWTQRAVLSLPLVWDI